MMNLNLNMTHPALIKTDAGKPNTHTQTDAGQPNTHTPESPMPNTHAFLQ